MYSCVREFMTGLYSSKISFIPTSGAGGRKLILEGYGYIKQRAGEEHSQWMCENEISLENIRKKAMGS